MTLIGGKEPHPTSLPAMGIAVTLPDFYLQRGIATGKKRQAEAVAAGRKEYPEIPHRDPEKSHIDGAIGEEVAAFWLGMAEFVPTINTFRKGGDVGSYQIRTRSGRYDELYVRADSRDDDIYILVRGTAPHFMIVGWLLAWDAKRPEWLKDHGGHGPAYFVPDTFLHNLVDLPKAVTA